jgi:predicted enzyme related to lactoylglutathione lyase
MDYYLCKTGEGEGIDGAVMKRQNAGQPWMNYIDVESIDAMLEKAQALGAMVALPRTPVPGAGGAIAAVVDPQGNVFDLWEKGQG